MKEQSKNDRELSEMVRELSLGTIEELKRMLPNISLRPILSDRKVHQALLDITPLGMEELYKEFGVAEVSRFISDFMETKEF